MGNVRSSLLRRLIDEVAARGLCLPLLATDDTHYYDGDQFRGMIMADADFVDSVGFSQMIRENRSMLPWDRRYTWSGRTRIPCGCVVRLLPKSFFCQCGADGRARPARQQADRGVL